MHRKYLRMERLAEFLKGTVSANPAEIKAAESQLSQLRASQGFPLALLETINQGALPMDVRLAAAIYFKNLVKREWESLGTSEERVLIKQHIVSLMLSLPRPLQAQISAAVTLISDSDFPLGWQSLVPQLVSAIGNDAHRQGALQTLHAVLDKYRTVVRSDSVLREMQFILPQLQSAHLECFKSSVSLLVNSSPLPRSSLEPIIEQTTLLSGIFLLMNSVDIPEFYEDHLSDWMSGFLALLNFSAASLSKRKGEEDEPSALDKLRTAVCENLALYAERYQEQFQPHVTSTVKAVWDFLCGLNAETGNDPLVASGIKFLASAAGTKWESAASPFDSPGALESICEKVVLPNLKLRESDEELFRDNPTEFIRRDVEGADQDTRRRAAMDLVRSLSKFHEVKVTEILVSFAQKLLTVNEWHNKEVCAYVVAATAAKAATRQGGVTKISQSVDVSGFFKSQLLPELIQGDREMLKACALKFLTSFRSFINVHECVPLIIAHLESPRVVIHTYAAHALSVSLGGLAKLDQQSTDVAIRVTLARLKNDKVHNEYIMRLVVSLLTLPISGDALNEAGRVLPSVLVCVIADPSNPQFAHSLFEALSILLTRQISESVENAILPILSEILSKNIAEFMPYAFQLLALLLERSVKPLFTTLFPMLLNDDLWRQTGVVSALVRLLDAYFVQNDKLTHLLTDDVIQRILGKVQFLLKSPKTEQSAFDLVSSIFRRCPLKLYHKFLTPLLGLLLGEIRDRKTERKVNSLAVCLSVFVVSGPGARELIANLDSIQGGLADQVIRGLWMPALPNLTGRVTRKVALLAAAALVEHVGTKPDVMPALLQGVQGLVIGGVTQSIVADQIPDHVDISFDAAFVKLKYASTNEDYAPQVVDENKVIKGVLAPHAGAIVSLPNTQSLIAWLGQP